MIKIKNLSTKAPDNLKKKKTKKETKKIASKIGEFSRIYEADRNHALLIVFQGMDSSGKDGTTREVFKYVSPGIVCANSFKKPTSEEMAHDFLWRVHKLVPGKGQIRIFNRSHYEDVLIQKVHHWIDDNKVEQRIKSINNFPVFRSLAERAGAPEFLEAFREFVGWKVPQPSGGEVVESNVDQPL